MKVCVQNCAQCPFHNHDREMGEWCNLESGDELHDAPASYEMRVKMSEGYWQTHFPDACPLRTIGAHTVVIA